MQPLLEPGRFSHAQARVLCRSWLARRWRGWRLALRILEPEVAADVETLGAWIELCREVSMAGDELVRERTLRALQRALARARDEQPENALGSLLRVALHRRGWDPAHLAASLAGRTYAARVNTFATRSELTRCIRAHSIPEADLALAVFALRAERARVLAQALALALELAQRTVQLLPAFPQGRVLLPMADLARHRVDLRALEPGRAASPEVQALFAAACAWARSEFAKGWPLCRELSARNARVLAFWLRFQAADLSALEARGSRLDARPPRSGPLRWLACASLAGLSPAPPRFS